MKAEPKVMVVVYNDPVEGQGKPESANDDALELMGDGSIPTEDDFELMGATHYREPSDDEMRSCGMHECTINDDTDAILGFEDENPMNRALAMIASKMLEAAQGGNDEDDVGMIVNVRRTSDAVDFGQMIEDIMSADNIAELRAIAEYYEGMPGAEELAAAYAQEMGHSLRAG